MMMEYAATDLIWPRWIVSRMEIFAAHLEPNGRSCMLKAFLAPLDYESLYIRRITRQTTVLLKGRNFKLPS